MTTRLLRPWAILICVLFALSGCETVKRFSDKGYTFSCVSGALVGGAIAYLTKGKGDALQDRDLKRRLLAGAAAGCAVGLAVTAVGKALNARQQAKHEESVQRTAKRQAKELQAYGETRNRYRQLPPATEESEKAARNQRMQEELAQIRQRYETPDTEDLGEGATSVVTPVFPASPPEAKETACFEQRVLVNTPSGKASQVQTMCPGKDGGEYVRAEVKQDAA